MKKKKLDLGKLEVKSFITSIDEKYIKTVKGGSKTLNKRTEEIVCTASGVCVCKSEDCETHVLCVSKDIECPDDKDFLLR